MTFPSVSHTATFMTDNLFFKSFMSIVIILKPESVPNNYCYGDVSSCLFLSCSCSILMDQYLSQVSEWHKYKTLRKCVEGMEGEFDQIMPLHHNKIYWQIILSQLIKQPILHASASHDSYVCSLQACLLCVVLRVATSPLRFLSRPVRMLHI